MIAGIEKQIGILYAADIPELSQVKFEKNWYKYSNYIVCLPIQVFKYCLCLL